MLYYYKELLTKWISALFLCVLLGDTCIVATPLEFFLSRRQIRDYTRLSDPPLSDPRTVPECLQTASILEHSFPGLNPTSDDFILQEI